MFQGDAFTNGRLQSKDFTRFLTAQPEITFSAINCNGHSVT